MKQIKHGKHLTMDDRIAIREGIREGLSHAAIALSTGKDRSTISKEIKAHRTVRRRGNYRRDCEKAPHCKYSHICNKDCPDFVAFTCKRRDKSPGVCDGCKRMRNCPHVQFTYSPTIAEHQYRETLVDSRSGVDMTSKEAAEMGEIIYPLLKHGLSPYQIVKMHPELNICEKTLYNYIEREVFHEVCGITNLDLRRQVSRSLPKKKDTQYKKRQDRRYLKGRTYDCYLAYLNANPYVNIVQMDTVYNSEETGPFMQTFKFVKYGLLFAVLHKEKTAAAMVSGVDLLEGILSSEVFEKCVEVLLTDRGGEFAAADRLEASEDGIFRTKVFYCDPMQASQKGSLENKHRELRYIFPKGKDLKKIGLVTQEALNLALSHINSTPQKSLDDKSPLEMTEFLCPELYFALRNFGIKKIDKDEIILNPALFKSK